MPKKIEYTYPNAYGSWHGCPMTCPDSCPFEECTMPGDIAVKHKPSNIFYGWAFVDGRTVMLTSSMRKENA